MRPIRRLAFVLAALLVALLANLSWIQVLDADSVRLRQGNTRLLLEQYNRHRGPILVQSTPIAYSERATGSDIYQRVYTDGSLYAPITGFYSLLYGATGLERTANDVLSGSDPRLFVDRLQQLFAGRRTSGGAVSLTIDPDVQAAAARALGDRPGAVVALVPNTGEILALVSSPSFDPEALAPQDPVRVRAAYSRLTQDPDQPMLNRAIARSYPPGSTFKLITAAAALASGRFNPDTVVPGPATYPLPGSTQRMRNWQDGPCTASGRLTLRRALELSCNTAFAWLGVQLGADALRTAAEQFGFDSSLTIPLTVAASRFPASPDAAQTAMSAIGQFDVQATALQMAMVAGSITNNGTLMRPFLVRDVRAPDLTLLETTAPRVLSTPLSRTTARSLRDMMIGVVERGTCSRCRITGVEVGAKTGTAETGTEAKPHAWVTAFAPGIAVAVVVEHGGDAAEVSGNQVAAPVATAVIRAFLAKS